MESVLHNDYRQQPITSDEAYSQYRRYLTKLEAMIAEQEDTVIRARSASDAAALILNPFGTLSFAEAGRSINATANGRGNSPGLRAPAGVSNDNISSKFGMTRARTTLWRLLTKRQGVLDELAAYEHRRTDMRG